MRTVAVSMLLIIALLSFGSVAFAEGKTTIDPNTPGVRETEETTDEVEIDARLDQKVTYEARRMTVLAILADLSEKTGITFRAGQNNKDWQSRDTKLNIFAKDITLRDLMTSMGRVARFRWTREKVDENYVYRFYMPRRTQADAEDRRLQEIEEKERKQAEKRERAFDAYTKTANLSPADLENLKKDNPFLYTIAKSGITGPMGQFLDGCPEAAQALMMGKAANLSSGSISAGSQEGLLRAMQSMWKMENTMGGRNRPFPDDIANNLGQISININRHMDEARGMPGADMMLGDMEMRCGEHHMNIPLIDPESDFAKVIGKAINKSTDEGVPMEEAMRDSQAEMMKVITAQMKGDQGEPTPEHPDEPDLHKKITLKPEGPELVDTQAALASASQLAVVTDSYGVSFGFMASRAGGGTWNEMELKDVLEKIGDTSSSNWEKHGAVIELSDRKWYEKRAAMIPEAWLESWRTTLEQTGTLDIGDLAQMASLTQEQILANIQPDQVFARCQLPWSFYSARDVLRLYSTLTETQVSALFSEAGLDLRALSPEQSVMAEKLVSTRNAGLMSNPDVRLIVTAKRKPVEKQFEYTFSVATGEESGPITFSFTTPSYQPPPPKPEPPAQAATEESTPNVDSKAAPAPPTDEKKPGETP